MNVKHLQQLLITFMSLGSIAPVKALFTDRAKLAKAADGLNAYALQRAYAQKSHPKTKLSPENVDAFLKQLPKDLQVKVSNQIVDKSQFIPTWVKKREIPLHHDEEIISYIKMSDQYMICATKNHGEISLKLIDFYTIEIVHTQAIQDTTDVWDFTKITQNKFAFITDNTIEIWQINDNDHSLNRIQSINDEDIGSIVSINDAYLTCLSCTTGNIEMLHIASGMRFQTDISLDWEEDNDEPLQLIVIGNFLIMQFEDSLNIYTITFDDQHVPHIQDHAIVDSEIFDTTQINDHIIACASKRDIIIHDLQSGLTIQTIPNIFNPEFIASLSFNDGQLLCVSTENNWKLYNVQFKIDGTIDLKSVYSNKNHTASLSLLDRMHNIKSILLPHMRWLTMINNKIVFYAIDQEAYNKLSTLTPNQILHLQALQAHIKYLRQQPVGQRILTAAWQARLMQMPATIRQSLETSLNTAFIARPKNPWLKFWDVFVPTALFSWYAFNRFYRHNRDATIFSLVGGSILGALYYLVRPEIYYA